MASGLLAMIAGVYLLLGLFVDFLVPRLSMDVEEKIAAVFAVNVLETDEATDLTRPLQELVDGLQKRCAPLPYRVTVHVFQSDTINALALPAGHLVIYTGLLAEMSSENELAFVLSHELGHYVHRDHLRGFGRALVLMAGATVLFGSDSSLSQLIGQAMMLSEMNFSRKQETRADEFAIETLQCHYGHVGDGTSFLIKIPKDADPGRFGHYFSSHPETQRRISHLDHLIRDRNYPVATPRPLPEALVANVPILF